MAEQQQTIPEELSQDESLKVLVGALNVAQRKGKFSFDEAEVMSKAVRTFQIAKDGETLPEIPTNVSQEDAIKILIGGVNTAQQRGAYSIDNASAMAKAVRAFAQTQAPAPAPASAPATASTSTGVKLETIKEEVEVAEVSADDNTIVI